MAVIRFLHVRVPHTSFRQTAYRFDQLSINYKQMGFKKDSPWVPRCWRIVYFAHVTWTSEVMVFFWPIDLYIYTSIYLEREREPYI